jgi:hypothetical protein
MFFRGILTIDPSQLTKIQKVAPSQGFKKLLFSMTGGQFAEKLEVETFKAMNILQQIHGSFSTVGVNNIIRLAHDDIDIYYDKKGEKNDLDFAMDKYQIQIDDSMSTHFKTLEMVLEHEDEIFKYLIEITINKSHKEGEYPIVMIISGMLKEFNLKSGQAKEELKAQMEKHFKDQESYNMFITTKKLAFEQFLESIRFETMKHIKVEDIKMDIKSRMVVQKQKHREVAQKEVQREYEGTPYGYFGFGDLILYSWLWSELSFDHNIHMSDVDLVTEGGEFISSVGEEGIDAADASIMDYNEDFDARMEDLGSQDLGASEMGDMEFDGEETTKGWFDGVFEDSDFDMDFGDW